jgi:hypothetical protein
MHITILLTHTVVFTFSSALVFRAFKNPSDFNIKAQSYSRIALFTSTGVVELILVYLVLRMIEPIRLEYDESASDSSQVAEDKREIDLSMMVYIRNMN